MKPVACYVSLIVVFCVLPNVHAEVVRDNVVDVNDTYGGSAGLGGDGAGFDAAAYAEGSDPICWAYGSGYRSATPTVAGYYQVSYRLDGSATALLILCTVFQQCVAQGRAELGVHGPGIADNSLLASVTVSSGDFQGEYDIPGDDDPEPINYVSGVVYCSAYQSIATTNDTVATAVVSDEASDVATSSAHSSNTCDMTAQ